MYDGLPQLGLSIMFPRGYPTGRSDRATQVGTKDKDHSIPWKLPISCRVSGPNFEHRNWEHFPPVPCGI